MKRAEIIDKKIRSIAQREREALAELIVELKNLDEINGYIDLGFNSLFDYLTNGVGYSAGAAQRRIDACRLAKDVPDLGERLEAGDIDLHHVTSISKGIRQASKKRKISAEEKRAVVDGVERQTESNTQQAVADFFDLEVITETKRRVQKDDSVRFEITMSREDAELIERAQGLVSHAVPSRNLVDFLKYVSEKIIKEKARPARERKKKNTATMAVKTDERPKVVVVDESGTAMMAVQKPVPQRMHRQVRSEQPICPECGSAWFPQTDHRRARWAGGGNERENLQTLCGPCNRRKYWREKHRH